MRLVFVAIGLALIAACAAITPRPLGSPTGCNFSMLSDVHAWSVALTPTAASLNFTGASSSANFPTCNPKSTMKADQTEAFATSLPWGSPTTCKSPRP